MKKVKLLLQKPLFKKWVNPIVRATIKTLVPPLGTGIEIVKNYLTPKGEKLPHNWTSIIIQIICWIAIIYAFGTKMITLDDLLNYLNFGQRDA